MPDDDDFDEQDAGGDDDVPDEDAPAEDDEDPGDGDGDPDGPQNLDDAFASEDDLPPIDDAVYTDPAAFPDATEEDFEDDPGDWTPNDYEDSAKSLFGQQEFFGDDVIKQRTAEGFIPFQNPAFGQGFDRIAPGVSQNVHLFERDGHLVAFGFVAVAVLAALRSQYRGVDFSHLDVAVPSRGDIAEPQPLPPAYANIVEQPAVDLRKYCSPVGDQQQTSRCSAFAWTHGTEMSRNLLFNESQRLSCNHTMLQFQQMQGDARDFRYAYQGGDGTVGGPEPGEVLVEHGVCRQELWPDDDPAPRTNPQQLETDARNRRLEGAPIPIALEDVKKVLSAGCPVQLSMNTGDSFSKVGRDGLFNAAEAPSGQHGRHAMLLVGYTGNFYIVKNSWGTDWGQQGYCYIPKNVLLASDPEFVAILLRKP